MNTTDTQNQVAQLIAAATIEAENTTWEQFYDVHETATDEQKAHAKKEALKDASNTRRRIREQAARDAKKLLAGDEPKGKRAARTEAKDEAPASPLPAAPIVGVEPLSAVEQPLVLAPEGKVTVTGTVTGVSTYQTKKHGEKVQMEIATDDGWVAVTNAPKSIINEVEAGARVELTATWTRQQGTGNVADGTNPRGARFL